MHTVTRYQTKRGLPGGSLLYSGGAASAGKMKRRAGISAPEGFVTVEQGRRISISELCRSVNEAATRWLRLHGVPTDGFSR